MTGTTDSTGRSLRRRSGWSRLVTALVGVLMVVSAAACTESDRYASGSEVRSEADSDDSDRDGSDSRDESDADADDRSDETDGDRGDSGADEDDSDGYGRAEALDDLMAGGLSHEVANCTLDEMQRRGIDFQEANESSTTSELFGEVVEIVTGCL